MSLLLSFLLGCHEPVAAPPGPSPAEAPTASVSASPAPTEPAAPARVEAAPVEAAPVEAAPPFTDALIPWTPERGAATEAYLQAHRVTPLTGDPEVDTRMRPQAIVLHWTAGPTAASARATFAPVKLAGRTELKGGGDLNVGAHFLVDRDGKIERLFDETRVVRHCIGLNHVAIGVENVGGGAEWPLTEAQVAADAALIRWLAARYPITTLLGHHEYQRMEHTPLFEEQDETYRTQKPDPGEAFMTSVRAALADLKLAAPPG